MLCSVVDHSLWKIVFFYVLKLCKGGLHDLFLIQLFFCASVDLSGMSNIISCTVLHLVL